MPGMTGYDLLKVVKVRMKGFIVLVCPLIISQMNPNCALVLVKGVFGVERDTSGDCVVRECS